MDNLTEYTFDINDLVITLEGRIHVIVIPASKLTFDKEYVANVKIKGIKETRDFRVRDSYGYYILSALDNVHCECDGFPADWQTRSGAPFVAIRVDRDA